MRNMLSVPLQLPPESSSDPLDRQEPVVDLLKDGHPFAPRGLSSTAQESLTKPYQHQAVGVNGYGSFMFHHISTTLAFPCKRARASVSSRYTRPPPRSDLTSARDERRRLRSKSVQSWLLQQVATRMTASSAV